MPIAGSGYEDSRDGLIRTMYAILAELYYQKRPPSEGMMVMISDRIESLGIGVHGGKESEERR